MSTEAEQNSPYGQDGNAALEIVSWTVAVLICTVFLILLIYLLETVFKIRARALAFLRGSGWTRPAITEAQELGNAPAHRHPRLQVDRTNGGRRTHHRRGQRRREDIEQPRDLEILGRMGSRNTKLLQNQTEEYLTVVRPKRTRRARITNHIHPGVNYFDFARGPQTNRASINRHEPPPPYTSTSQVPVEVDDHPYHTPVGIDSVRQTSMSSSMPVIEDGQQPHNSEPSGNEITADDRVASRALAQLRAAQ